MTMQKKYFRDVRLLTVLCMSLYTYFNLKFNSVYYAQHIPHKEGTEPDLVMLVKNVGRFILLKSTILYMMVE